MRVVWRGRGGVAEVRRNGEKERGKSEGKVKTEGSRMGPKWGLAIYQKL